MIAQMRKFLFLASLLLSVTVFAGPVTPTDAQKSASAFLNKHNKGTAIKTTPANAPRMMGNQSSSQPGYYVFNTEGDKGYVIVSGDDRTTPILGYVDSGQFDYNKLPVNMKEMLAYYEEQIAALDA